MKFRKKVKRIVIFFILFGSVRLSTSAQDFDPPLRLEFDMTENKYPINMEPLGKNGLALLFQKESKEDAKWIVCHYDTNFQLLKMRSVPFETKTVVCAIGSNENFFYAILQNEASTKVDVTNTYILCYDAVTKKIDVFSFYHAEKEKILSIIHFGNFFIYSTYNSKSEEQVYLFNTQSLTHTVLYQDKTGSYEFQDAYLDAKSLWVISKQYEAKKQTSIHLTQLDTNGTILQEIPMVSEGKYSINSCRIVYSDSNNNLLLSGNYLDSEENKHSTRNNNSGIFTVTIKDDQVGQMLFFDYSTLENWYAINKRNLSYYYDLLYFVTQNDSMVILASDFYAPEYQQYYVDQYSSGIGFYPSSMAADSKLIGFRYQNACIFTFNKEGNMLWYTPLNYSGLLLKSVRPLLNGYIDPETDDVLCIFGFNNKIFSLIYNQTNIVQAIKSTIIQSASRFENIISAEKAICQYWYDNHFIYSAYQWTSKKYNSHSRKNSKYVFGVNKLVYK